jgi:hypothetical protein
MTCRPAQLRDCLLILPLPVSADSSEPAVTAEQLQARLQAQINDPDSVLRKGVVSEWLMVDQTFATSNTTCEPRAR